jgi:hypothetical protein
MNRRAFLAGLLASSALARAPARIPMVSPAPVYLASSPSTGELLLAVPPAQYAAFREAWLELVEGRLGTIKGFEFIS